MSTVFDVAAVSVDGGTSAAFDTTIDTVTISDVTTTPSVTIDTPESVDAVTVEVPGVQGPPGLQNVFPSATDPSDESWGVEETGFIWIQI